MRRLLPIATVIAACQVPPGADSVATETQAATGATSADSGDAPDDGADDQPDPSTTSGPGDGDTAADEESDAADTDPPGPFEELDCADGVDDDDDGKLDCYDNDCWADPGCTDRQVRVATWNVRGIGSEGSLEQDQLVAVLDRIDADVVCLQEIDDSEADELDAVAARAGYPYSAIAPESGPAGGMMRGGCLSRYEIAGAAAVDSWDLSDDPDANDITRPFLRLRIDLGDPIGRYLTVLAVHLKSGTEDADRFRRMVEAVRLAQAVALERATYPGNAIVALGDFNETPRFDAGSYPSPPGGLPGGYSLGSDIELPLTYDPFAPVAGEGLELVDATLEDLPFDSTYLPGLVRLDYIYEDAEDVLVSEVYEACEDNGVDDNPIGDLMPKAGDPLPCGTNGDTSDHRPVVAVLYFP